MPIEGGEEEVDPLSYDEVAPPIGVRGDVLGGMLAMVDEMLLIEVLHEVVLAPSSVHEVLVDQGLPFRVAVSWLATYCAIRSASSQSA